MKKIENNFAVTGFVAKDAEVRQFTTTSVARFPLAVARQEKIGEETKRISAFMNIEAWRKNENSGSFDQLTKGTLLTVEGYFKPEEWTDKDGVQHNRIVTAAFVLLEAFRNIAFCISRFPLLLQCLKFPTRLFRKPGYLFCKV